TGMTQNMIDVNMNQATGANVTVRDSTFVGMPTALASTGVAVAQIGAGRVNVQLTNVSIKQTVNGVHASAGFTTVDNSVITQISSFGLVADGTAALSAIGNTLMSNGTAVQANGSAVVRLSNNDVYDNLTGFGCGGSGSLATAGNNRKFNNV